MDYIISFFKAIGMFIVGLTAFRIMGNQAVGRLSDFDLVIVIAVGTLIGAPLADAELHPFIAVAAITGLVFLQIVTSWLVLKSPLIERLIIGRPIKLIDQGQILFKGLRKARLTKNQLFQELRSKGFEDTELIQETYIEPSGDLSVIEVEDHAKN